jgi:hypothetical protein
MKALLEFAYPEDELKLQHALKANEYYEALREIELILATSYTKVESHAKIKQIITDIMEEI